jgi:dihydroxyacid dehydratase/phosphogluconate dehydratase
MARKKPEELRSHRWYGASDLRSFGHRSHTAQMGFDAADHRGKPVIAIVDTWSDINPCHTHVRQRAEDVKRGIWQAGGFPVEANEGCDFDFLESGPTVPEREIH